MITIFRIINNVNTTSSDLCYELINCLFTAIQPSYFKDDCYNTGFVEKISLTDFKKTCKLLTVVYSDTDSEKLFEIVKKAAFGEKERKFYYLDCKKGNESYSPAQTYIINKVVELCYSEFISSSLFKKYANDSKIKLLSADSGVAEKVNWLKTYLENIMSKASSMTDTSVYSPDITEIYGEISTAEDPTAAINIDFSDRDVTAEDFLKEEYRGLVQIEQNLDNTKPPLKNKTFWDSLIFSATQIVGSMFDYDKYTVIRDSLSSIQDIINLFDSQKVTSLINKSKLSAKDKESLWTAMIYDAIYYSYITVSLCDFTEEHQTSIKMMCKQFYEQYVIPITTGDTRWNSFFEILFNQIGNTDSANEKLSNSSYRKVMSAYRKYCAHDDGSLAYAFNSKIKAVPRNTHFSEAPEFYETILLFVFLLSNIQSNKPQIIDSFKSFYRELVRSDNMYRKTNEAIFNYEVGWYFFNILINHAVRSAYKNENNYDYTRHPTIMIFTLKALDDINPEIKKLITKKFKAHFDEMTYIISIIMLKMRYCSSEKYSEIISGIKSIIVKKQATIEYKVNINLNDTDISMLQQRKKKVAESRFYHKFKESLNPNDTTTDRIRKLFKMSGAEYTKEQIMQYCDRKKASVEKALYGLIKSGELNCSYNSKEKKYKSRNKMIAENLSVMSEIFRELTSKHE